MNLSGEVLIKFKDFYKIDLNDIQVKGDDTVLYNVNAEATKQEEPSTWGNVQDETLQENVLIAHPFGMQ